MTLRQQNYRKREKHVHTHDDIALYGIFASGDSDSDSYGGLGSSKKRRKEKDGTHDLFKPVNFVMPNQQIDRILKEESKDSEPEDKVPQGLGFSSCLSASINSLDVKEKEGHVDFLPTASGEKIKEEIGAFEKHTKGIGMKLLERDGYKKGEALGNNHAGIVAPIEVKLRPKNMGLGFNDYKEPKLPTSKETEEKSLPRTSQPPEAHLKGKLWSRQVKAKKKICVTAQEILGKKQKQSVRVVEKILDMTGPQVRVLTSLKNLNAGEKARKNDVLMPEIQRNIKTVVDAVGFEIRKIDHDLRNEKETVIALRKEKEKLQEEESSRQKKQLDSMKYISSVLEQIEEMSSLGTMTLDTLAQSFVNLQQLYPEEYKVCNLSLIARSYAVPLFISIFQGWEPLQNPVHGLEVVSEWKTLLEGEDSLKSSDIASPYTQLIMEVVYPAVRITGTNTWQARDPEPMLRFLEFWEKLLPQIVLQTILDYVIMPKISSAVDSWDPRTEAIAIHSWIHPWLPLLGHRLEVCYHSIRDRLGGALHAWHPSDMSAYYILSPWKSVFDAASWEKLIARYVIPKLLTVMHEFEINPANQKLDQFHWVRTWATDIPDHHVLHLMDIFFNKWQEVLYQWLCSNPNFEEVAQWYLGWKDLLPPELLANEHIRYRLILGLDMMNQAVEGMEVVRPGLKENISYLGLREKSQFERAAAQVQERASVGLGSGSQAQEMNTGLKMSLKEVIEVHAQQNGLLFKPKPGRMQDGHQVYGFGNTSIILDSLSQKVFAQIDEKWSLVSLEQLLELHSRASLRRVEQ